MGEKGISYSIRKSYLWSQRAPLGSEAIISFFLSQKELRCLLNLAVCMNYRKRVIPRPPPPPKLFIAVFFVCLSSQGCSHDLSDKLVTKAQGLKTCALRGKYSWLQRHQYNWVASKDATGGYTEGAWGFQKLSKGRRPRPSTQRRAVWRLPCPAPPLPLRTLCRCKQDWTWWALDLSRTTAGRFPHLVPA